MNKKKLMVLIAALLAVALLITLGVVSSINAKEQARLEAERKQLQEHRDEKNHSSKGGCKRCGEKGVPLTAAGYCKVCVDCYYTDYYIGWDGEVHADLPY